MVLTPAYHLITLLEPSFKIRMELKKLWSLRSLTQRHLLWKLWKDCVNSKKRGRDNASASSNSGERITSSPAQSGASILNGLVKDLYGKEKPVAATLKVDSLLVEQKRLGI